MTKIADRWPLGWSAALAGAVAIALLLIMVQRHDTPAPRAKRVTVDRKCVEPRPHVAEPCPAWARDRLKLGPEAIVTCVHGNYGERGSWFVHALYTTTERWERYGIVAADGSHELASFVDRPSLFDAAGYRAGDIDGDGVDEVLVRYPSAHETLQLRGGELTTQLVRDN